MSDESLRNADRDLQSALNKGLPIAARDRIQSARDHLADAMEDG